MLAASRCFFWCAAMANRASWPCLWISKPGQNGKAADAVPKYQKGRGDPRPFFVLTLRGEKDQISKGKKKNPRGTAGFSYMARRLRERGKTPLNCHQMYWCDRDA